MSTSSPPMAPAFSLYLDLVRILGASAVVAAHFAYTGAIAPGAWGVGGSMGREAVILFFVLSGFVIAATTDQARPDARSYAVARLSRLYSVVLPVLLLALACAAFLVIMDRSVPNAGYALGKPHVYIPFYLLFLGQSWTLTETPPFMVPYWSLCYEAWYYLLFGLAHYLRGRRRMLALLLALAVMGYKMWLLLPVWLAGAWLYRAYREPLMSPGVARAGWIGSLLAFAIYVGADLETPLRALGSAWWPFPALPLGSADRFLADYLVGAIVLLNFACARDAGFAGLLRFKPAIRLLAGHTFTLYLSHMLVIGMWLALYPHTRGNGADILGLLLAIIVATALLGGVTERRLPAWRALFARLPGLRPSRKAGAVVIGN
ncbi:acyltransferase [Massilia sp. G4R7]|uniref:Acyltransferase n=1 Tax=Massilia phyllostachyos TaxID=2898585 RepID=A0ABS8QA08_9BURK|nr:acyltransferase [Massilia phyllostachyos]MCD2518593.1 acyltransferase [Massilia phyllostachyos]